MLRRLEKRILVPLPNTEGRKRMFEALLQGRCSSDVSFAAMAERTAGYSGSDVAVVAKEAAMRPLRRMLALLESTTHGAAAAGNAGGAGDRQAANLQVWLVHVLDVLAYGYTGCWMDRCCQ